MLVWIKADYSNVCFLGEGTERGRKKNKLLEIMMCQITDLLIIPSNYPQYLGSLAHKLHCSLWLRKLILWSLIILTSYLTVFLWILSLLISIFTNNIRHCKYTGTKQQRLNKSTENSKAWFEKTHRRMGRLCLLYINHTFATYKSSIKI